MERITFELETGAWHGSATERLWAESVGSDRFRLRNVPFYAFGVSVEDIVRAEDRAGQLYFKEVSIRGGHSTYRLMLSVDLKSEQFEKAWAPLRELGCTYEEGTVLAVDVPPSTDIYAVYSALEHGLSVGAWDFEEGHCGHLLRDSSTPQQSRG